MTIHVSKDVESSINAAVQSGLFASAGEMIEKLVDDFTQHHPAASQPATKQAKKPVWERIQDLTADVSDEEWDKVPPDLAEQRKHYLYGTPKRQTT